MNRITDIEAAFAACDISTFTLGQLSEVLGLKQRACGLLLGGMGTSFNRMKQEEVRRRIKEVMATNPETVAELGRRVGVSQACLYDHFSTMYKTTPKKAIGYKGGRNSDGG